MLFWLEARGNQRQLLGCLTMGMRLTGRGVRMIC